MPLIILSKSSGKESIMCLLKDKKVRNNHHKEDGYCVAYKIITISNDSPYLFFRYKEGCNDALFLCTWLDTPDFQFTGLHLFLSLRETKSFALRNFYNRWMQIPKHDTREYL